MSRAIVKREKILGALILLCLSQNVFAVEEIALKLKSGTVSGSTFGKDACIDTELVEIILGDNILKEHDDFRAYVKSGDKKDPKKSACPETISDSIKDVELIGKNSLRISQNFLLGGKKSSACSGNGSTGERLLCIYPEHSGATKLVAFARYAFDTQKAEIKGLVADAIAANGEIEFTIDYKGTSRVKQMEICYGPASNGDITGDTCPTNLGFNSVPQDLPKAKLKDLMNRTAYKIKVRLIDPGDKDQKWFNLPELTPIPIAVPLSAYDGQGGELSFSCQSSPSSAYALLFAVALLMMVLRYRRKAGVIKGSLFVLPLLCLVPAKSSRADFGQVNVGLLGSMYRPDLDSEKTSSGQDIFPFYKCFFRKANQENGRINPLMGLEVDMHLWDGFGSLQGGIGLGYTYVPGRGLEVDDHDRPICDKPAENYKVVLHIYQIRPQLTYIFDPFVDYFPLAPYVRGAFIINGYAFQDNDHSAKTVISPSTAPIKANGFRFGYQAALGLMLRLDFLEPSAVRAARGSGFFDHVYLKGELSYTKIDSFGKPGFQFSSKDVMGSALPLMWTFGLVFELP